MAPLSSPYDENAPYKPRRAWVGGTLVMWGGAADFDTTESDRGASWRTAG